MPKEFKYRGNSTEDLKIMSNETFFQLLNSRQRRTIKRGFSENHRTGKYSDVNPDFWKFYTISFFHPKRFKNKNVQKKRSFENFTIKSAVADS